MTQPTATPAAATPATPAAAPTIDSLIPADPAPAPAQPAATPAAPAAAAPAAQPATPAAEQPAWFYSDGTPGKGAAPEWFKADKYKTIEAQAQAYPELEKRFGSFVGAPTTGKYDFKLPDGVSGELDTEHPLLAEFTDWGLKNQLSQDGYNHLLGLLAKYEASQVVDMGAVKKQIGEKADERIGSLVQWGKANLPGELYNDLRASMSEKNAAVVFKVLEHVVDKTRQPALPAPGADVIAAQPQGIAAVQAKMREKDANGGIKYFTDAKFRAECDAAMRQATAAQ